MRSRYGQSRSELAGFVSETHKADYPTNLFETELPIDLWERKIACVGKGGARFSS